MSLRNRYESIGLLNPEYNLTREELNISLEYDWIDWRRLLAGPFNQLSRFKDNTGTTKVDNLPILIGLFTGPATEFGKVLNLSLWPAAGAALASTLVPFLAPVFIGGAVAAGLTNLLVGLWGNEYAITAHMDKKNVMKNLYDIDINPYLYFVHNYKKVDFENFAKYDGLPNRFRELIEYIKVKLCPLIPERPLTTGEKNALKLYAPDYAMKEIGDVQLYVKKLKLAPDLKDKWIAFYNDLISIYRDVIEYISVNVDLTKRT